MKKCLFLAHGLQLRATGIENAVLALSQAYVSSSLQAEAPLAVSVDAGSRWATSLPPSVDIREVRRPTLKPRLHARSDIRETRIVHSFGASLAGVSRQTSAVYTVHDWGPVRDGNIALRARASWASAMWQSLGSADHVHFYSESVAAETPRGWRGRVRGSTFIAPPVVLGGGTASRPLGSPRAFALFVGAVSARKRLDLVVDACARSRGAINVIAVGDGTQDLPDVCGLVGLGRVSQERLNALYDTCAAVVLVSDYEGFGLPVAEAARRGVRSLVSPQVARVQQDLTPYLVTVAQSPDALHNALRQMVQQPVRLDPHVGAGAARYLHLYRGLLGAQA